MLISVSELQRKFHVNPDGILHVGAHKAEEANAYLIAGWSQLHPIVWVESQPDLAADLVKNLDSERNRVYCATVWSESNKTMVFHNATNSQSSSLLELGTHSRLYPEIVYKDHREIRTVRLDELIEENVCIELLNLDIQGAELEAIKGLGDRLESVKWIYSEVNKKEVYQGCARISELDSYLKKFGFRRVATRWVFGSGWGDALWVHKDQAERIQKAVIIFSLAELAHKTFQSILYLKHKIKIRKDKIRLDFLSRHRR